MKESLKRIAGALAIGLIWVALWAIAGALIRIADPGGSLNAVWLGPTIGVQPGFVGGVVFSVVLGIAARPRKPAELSLLTAGACGAMIGVGLGLLPFAINKLPGQASLLVVASVVIGAMTLMSVFSAVGSVALARAARAS